MRTLGVIGGLMLVTSAATAAPGSVARLSEDVDGDGTADAVELGSDGVLQIGGKRHAAVTVGGALTAGTVALGHAGGHPVIVVELTTGTRHEAVLVEPGATGWREAMRFAIGDVGLDADYGVAIEVTADGIYRYQTRREFQRCDGKPAYLFAEGFDGARFRRVTRPPTHLPATLPMIAAHLDPAPAAEPLLYQARWASHEPGVADAGGLAIPAELDDGKPATTWHEELAASAGEGQLFNFVPRVAGARARQLRIIGAAKTFNRLQELAIVTAQGAWRVRLPDAVGDAYVVDLPEPIAGCVSVVVQSTYGPDKGTTAIAELEVFADGERSGGGEAMLAHVVAEGKEGVTSAASAIARRGAAGATALDGELAKTTDAGARRRLIGALVKIQDPAAGPALARAATEGWVREADLIDVIDALARNGMAQELHDLAATGGVALEARVAAASHLAGGGAGFALLVDLAGKGPRELRHTVIERLGTAPQEALIQAALAQTSSMAAGDLWRAVTRRSRTLPAERATAVQAMTGALGVATDYERRYRLVDGLASLGDAGALAALAQMLNALPAGAETSALRQVAVRAIGNAPRAEALPLVLALARDPDPGVRLAVLTALSGAAADPSSAWHTGDNPDGIDRVMITALSGDAWPEVRRRAATSLGARCQRLGPAHALADAVAHDSTTDVRTDALTALVECHAAGIAELLARTWDDGKAPVELRTHAVDLAVALGDRALGTALVAKFTRWRGAAIESAEALALAQSAAAAIGRLDAPGAAQALIAGLDDSAFPEIVSASAMGLGALGKACPPAAKAKLTLMARSDDQAALAARQAAKQCGK